MWIGGDCNVVCFPSEKSDISSFNHAMWIGGDFNVVCWIFLWKAACSPGLTTGRFQRSPELIDFCFLRIGLIILVL